jgi:hypothetical protein
MFAVATVFNIGLEKSNQSKDVSLESIAVMAQAQAEYGYGIQCKYIPELSMCWWTAAREVYCGGAGC